MRAEQRKIWEARKLAKRTKPVPRSILEKLHQAGRKQYKNHIKNLAVRRKDPAVRQIQNGKVTKPMAAV